MMRPAKRIAPPADRRILAPRGMNAKAAHRSINHPHGLTAGHGSTRALTNSTGAVVTGTTYDYDAYGQPLNFTASTAKTNWLFGGDGVYDSASGWTYHLARWRDGFRFTSFDSFEANPKRPANLHKYAYATSNSVSCIDASGHEPSLPGQLSVAGILAIGGSILLGTLATVHLQQHASDFHFSITLPTSLSLGLFASAEESREAAEEIVDHALGAPGRSDDFPDWTNGERDLIIDYVEGLIDAAVAGSADVLTGVDPERGRKAIFDLVGGVIVILGGPDGPGTAFKPEDGKDYFDENFPGKPGR